MNSPDPPNASLMDDKLRKWVRLWTESDSSGEAVLVENRLKLAVRQLFGSSAAAYVENRARHANQSLIPTTEPLLTAFLGRRSTRELTRRVLIGI